MVAMVVMAALVGRGGPRGESPVLAHLTVAVAMVEMVDKEEEVAKELLSLPIVWFLETSARWLAAPKELAG